MWCKSVGFDYTHARVFEKTSPRKQVGEAGAHSPQLKIQTPHYPNVAPPRASSVQ
jgi:hypothetical protein